MSVQPTTKDIQSGDASVLSARVPRGQKPLDSVPPPAKTVGPTTLSQRARIDIAEMARDAGLTCDIEPSRSVLETHLHLRTKKVKIFGRVKVMGAKFQVREHLSDTVAFARLKDEGTIPVLWLKRSGAPALAILEAEHLFRLLALAEGIER